MKILLLDNYDSFTYNLLHAVKELGATDIEVVRNDQIGLDNVERFDKIILSPGPGIPEEAGLLLPIIKKYAATKTILGFVYNTKTKTSNRVVSVLPAIMNELAQYKIQQDITKKKLGQDYYNKLNLVFPRQDGYFTDTGTFLDAFSRIQRKLEIPHRSVHAIRHTFATRALESGILPIVVSRTLGHASIQITMDIYGHVVPDFAEQEMAKMEEVYK